MKKPSVGLRLPVQSPPVSRSLMVRQGHMTEAGVEAAQTGCDKLAPGPERDACHALAAAASSAAAATAAAAPPPRS